MSLKEFLREEKEERKNRRKLAKEQKKGKLTKEQKKYKIAGIIFGFALLFGCIFYSCSTLLSGGGYSWNSILGITDEMIESLSEDVDVGKLYTGAKIGDDDWQSCKSKLKKYGVDFDNAVAENFAPTKNFTLDSRQLAALATHLMSESGLSVTGEIQFLEFYMIDETIYQRSVVYLDLSKLIIGAKLPSVYLVTKSKVKVLDNKIAILSSDALINNLDFDTSKEIIEVLNNNSIVDVNEIGNTSINTAIDVFVKSISCTIEVGHGHIKFRV